MNFDNLTLEHGLVIKSDTLDSEGTYSNSRKPSTTFSRMKWYLMSICLERLYGLYCFY